MYGMGPPVYAGQTRVSNSGMRLDAIAVSAECKGTEKTWIFFSSSKHPSLGPKNFGGISKAFALVFSGKVAKIWGRSCWTFGILFCNHMSCSGAGREAQKSMGLLEK